MGQALNSGGLRRGGRMGREVGRRIPERGRKGPVVSGGQGLWHGKRVTDTRL